MPSTLGIVAGGATSFVPTDLPSLIGWWDASDASTFTYSSGTSVSQWSSRVGSYNAVQSTAASQPTRSATINSRSAVVFDGSDDFLTVSSFNMTGGQKFSVWMVAISTVGTGNRMFLEHSNNFNNNPGGWVLFHVASTATGGAANSAGLSKNGALGGGSYSERRATTALSASTAKAIVVTHDGTLSTDETMVWVNDDNAGFYNRNDNTNADNLNTTLYVASRGGASNFLTGTIAEFGIHTAILSASDRVKLSAYLSQKWGL